MNYEKYWDYLDEMYDELRLRYPRSHSDYIFLYFKLTASPYHYWLENRAVMGSVPTSPGTEAGSPSTETDFAEYRKREGVPCQEQLEHEANLHKKATEGKGTGAEDIVSSSMTVTTNSTRSPSNLADKAQEIRQKARVSIREYMKTREKQWSSEATTGLLNLANDWGKGMTTYKALDLIPDKELCLWNDKHGVFL